MKSLWIALSLIFQVTVAFAQNGGPHGGGDEYLKELQSRKIEMLAQLKEWWADGLVTNLTHAEINQIEKVAEVLVVSYQDWVVLPENTENGKKGDPVTILNTRCTDQDGKIIWDLTACVTKPAWLLGVIRWGQMEGKEQAKNELVFHELISTALGKDFDFKETYRILHARDEKLKRQKDQMIRQVEEIGSRLLSYSRADFSLLEAYAAKVHQEGRYRKCVKRSTSVCQEILQEFYGAARAMRGGASTDEESRRDVFAEGLYYTDVFAVGLEESLKTKFTTIVSAMFKEITIDLAAQYFGTVELMNFAQTNCNKKGDDGKFVECVVEDLIPLIRIKIAERSRVLSNQIPKRIAAAKARIRAIH